MSDFSVTKMALAGYRLLAARPMVALWWFAFALALMLIQMTAAVTMAGPQLAALQDMREAGQTDPASMMAISRGMAGYNLFSLVFPWVTGAVIVAAATRAALSPDKSAFGYLRFGADELRLLITTLVLGVILGAVAVAAAIMGVILLAVTGGMEAFRTMSVSGVFPPSAIGPMLAGAAPGLILLIFLWTKFSLAGADTVGGKAVNIFGSWSLTRGRFWKILAVNLLGLIPVAVLSVAAFVAMTAGDAGGYAEKMQAMQRSMTSFDQAFRAPRLISYAISALSHVLVMACLIFPAGLIFQTVQPDEISVFDDDDDDDD